MEPEDGLDLREAPRVRLDPFGVPAEGSRGVGELGARGFERAGERCERPVELRRGPEVATQAGELVADGPLPFVEPFGCAPRRFPSRPMLQPPAPSFSSSLLVPT